MAKKGLTKAELEQQLAQMKKNMEDNIIVDQAIHRKEIEALQKELDKVKTEEEGRRIALRANAKQKEKQLKNSQLTIKEQKAAIRESNKALAALNSEIDKMQAEMDASKDVEHLRKLAAEKDKLEEEREAERALNKDLDEQLKKKTKRMKFLKLIGIPLLCAVTIVAAGSIWKNVDSDAELSEVQAASEQQQQQLDQYKNIESSFINKIALEQKIGLKNINIVGFQVEKDGDNVKYLDIIVTADDPSMETGFSYVLQLEAAKGKQAEFNEAANALTGPKATYPDNATDQQKADIDATNEAKVIYAVDTLIGTVTRATQDAIIDEKPGAAEITAITSGSKLLNTESQSIRNMALLGFKRTFINKTNKTENISDQYTEINAKFTKKDYSAIKSVYYDWSSTVDAEKGINSYSVNIHFDLGTGEIFTQQLKFTSDKVITNSSIIEQVIESYYSQIVETINTTDPDTGFLIIKNIHMAGKVGEDGKFQKVSHILIKISNNNSITISGFSESDIKIEEFIKMSTPIKALAKAPTIKPITGTFSPDIGYGTPTPTPTPEAGVEM